MGVKDTGGSTVVTGKGIEVYQLLVVKSALELEKLGLRSRGGSIRKGWALRFQLPANATRDDVIEAIEAQLESLRPKVQAENAAGI